MRYLGRAMEKIWAGDFVDRDGSSGVVRFIRSPLSETTVAVALEGIDAGMTVEVVRSDDGRNWLKRATPEQA